MADLRSLISALVKVPDGPPIVTLYLDARWKDEHQRDRVRLFFHDRAREARGIFDVAAPEAQGIRQSLDRVQRFVDGLVNQDIHPDARGVMVVASEPRALFEEALVEDPFEPAMFIDSKPRLAPLIEAAFLVKPAYLVEVDARSALILELGAEGMIDEHSLEREVPSRHKQGGWSAPRFARHVKEHIRMVWNEAAKLLVDFVRQDGSGAIVLFGQEPNLRAFSRELPPELQGRIVAMRPAPRDRRALLASAREALEEERIAHEFAVVHRILRQGLADRSGTVGLDDTLLAMNERRVRLLAVSRRFQARGYRCERCDALSAAGATACVFCDGPTTIVNLREELLRRCVAQGAEVLVTPESGPLDAYRGIGALLRHLTGEERQHPAGSTGVETRAP